MRPLHRIADAACAALAAVVPGRLLSRPKHFRTWERRGVHVTPVGFGQPIPDLRELDDGIFDRESEMVGVDLNPNGQLAALDEFSRLHRDRYDRIPLRPGAEPHAFYLENGYFSSPDAEALYGMVHRFRPRRVIEIGSGFSTRLFVEAIGDLRDRDPEYTCDFTTIDPQGGEMLRGRLPGEARQIRRRVQDLPVSEFQALRESDILFIDSSHVARVGSDVTCEVLEILPRLAPGVVVHVHDICFPREYPREYAMRLRRFWNEQYLLHAFLIHNERWRVLWSSSWLRFKHHDRLLAGFPSYRKMAHPGGGSFWMQRLR